MEQKKCSYENRDVMSKTYILVSLTDEGYSPQSSASYRGRILQSTNFLIYLALSIDGPQGINLIIFRESNVTFSAKMRLKNQYVFW